MYTGNSGRKAKQPRGARKGPGAIGTKLRLALLAAAVERWAPPPLRPVAGAAFSPRLCDLTARFLLSPRLLLEVRAQVCPFSYLFSGSQRVMGAQRSLAKGFPTKIWPASFSSLVFKSFSVRFGN